MIIYDWYYIALGIILIPGIILAVWAQIKVNSSFEKYDKQPSELNIPANKLARQLLDASNLSDITEGYELWLLDDMTLAVTYFYNMKVRSKDKFEAVTYRYFMKDGLYKFGYDFEEDAFLGKIEYIIAKELCCNTECDNKCEECKYGEIISEYEDDFDDECIGDECDDCPYKDNCTL